MHVTNINKRVFMFKLTLQMKRYKMKHRCINTHMCIEFSKVSQYEWQTEFLANLADIFQKGQNLS